MTIRYVYTSAEAVLKAAGTSIGPNSSLGLQASTERNA